MTCGIVGDPENLRSGDRGERGGGGEGGGREGGRGVEEGVREGGREEGVREGGREGIDTCRAVIFSASCRHRDNTVAASR